MSYQYSKDKAIHVKKTVIVFFILQVDGAHTFTSGICPKVNLIAWLDVELFLYYVIPII